MSKGNFLRPVSINDRTALLDLASNIDDRRSLGDADPAVLVDPRITRTFAHEPDSVVICRQTDGRAVGVMLLDRRGGDSADEAWLDLVVHRRLCTSADLEAALRAYLARLSGRTSAHVQTIPPSSRRIRTALAGLGFTQTAGGVLRLDLQSVPPVDGESTILTGVLVGAVSAPAPETVTVATAMPLSARAREELEDLLGPGFMVVDIKRAPPDTAVVITPAVSEMALGSLRGMFPNAQILIGEFADENYGVSYPGPVLSALESSVDGYVVASDLAHLSTQVRSWNQALTAGEKPTLMLGQAPRTPR